MKAVVFDTNILIDHVHGKALWLDTLLKENNFTLVIPTVVISEYLAAQENEIQAGYKASKLYLVSFRFQSLTEEIAEILGSILRKKTYPKGANFADLIIAATTLFLNGELATRNRKDFSIIPGLRFFDSKSLIMV